MGNEGNGRGGALPCPPGCDGCPSGVRLRHHLLALSEENESLRRFNVRLWAHLQEERRLLNELHARSLERRDSTIRALRMRLASGSLIGVAKPYPELEEVPR